MSHPSKAAAELAGFKQFLVKQNVVGLAVGVIVGGAAAKIVGSLVENIINPLVGLVMGKGAFADFTVGPMKIGAFLNSSIDFLILLAVVYFVINKAVAMVMSDEAEAKK